jgi:cob(I)alamin adenosyltransferase
MTMNQEIKIYTKFGDKGHTSLLGGSRVPKYHQKIEAYGTIDELNSFVGLVRDNDISEHYKQVLLIIQERLFVMESLIAAESEEFIEALPKLTEEDIELLEKEIDAMNKELPELKNFILPGGHQVVSYCHVARTICRRAERIVIKLSQEENVDSLAIKYLNRLSDYFFVLARKIALDLEVEEIHWKPEKKN